jgi:hypothetical protein
VGCGEIDVAETSAKSFFTANSGLSRSTRSATSAVMATARCEVRDATQRPGAGGPPTRRDSSARRRHHGVAERAECDKLERGMEKIIVDAATVYI